MAKEGSAVVWNVYCIYTHKLVESTDDIKSFCEKMSLGKNAHIHIYKTNQYNAETGKHSLATYKGYFIRRDGDESVPFPELVLKEPTTLKIYSYPEGEFIDEVNYGDLSDWMVERGNKPTSASLLRATYKLEIDGKIARKQYKGMYARPAYYDIDPDLIEKYSKIHYPSPSIGHATQNWVIFDDSLNIEKITNNISDFCNAHEDLNKVLYYTNHVKYHAKQGLRTVLNFYHGFCVRPEKEVLAGTALPLPVPIGGDALSGGKDLIVWSEDDRKDSGVTALIVPAYQKTFKLDVPDKESLYKLADGFMNDPVARLNGKYGAVYVSDLGNSDVEDLLSVLEVTLQAPVKLVNKED